MLLKITTGAVLILLILPVFLFSSEVVKLPGSIIDVASYIQAFSATEENLVYHLNDILLFEQIPEFEAILEVVLRESDLFRFRYSEYLRACKMYTNIRKMTLKQRFKKIISQHLALKEYLNKIQENPPGKISLDLKQPQERAIATFVLKLLGLELKEESNRIYRLVEIFSFPEFQVNHYYQILGFNNWALERELNKTHRFNFQFKEFDARIPWTFDFLREITGLEITPDSFTEILLRDKRFRLLIGILYRLSDREIGYINQLYPNLEAWKKIYHSDEFLCGMFILSHALRVKNGRILLPGAPEPNAAPFWNQLTGSDSIHRPLEFLEQLAVKDGGKLNYFYTFTFFLPEDTRKIVWCNFNEKKFREIYRLVRLNKKEKIRGIDIPGLEDFGFFTLVYALKIQNNDIRFPGGNDAWAKAIGRKVTKRASIGSNSSGFELLKHLLRSSKKKDSLKRFIPIYCKFFHRQEILTEEVIRVLYENYLKYNVLVDFIEKIPVKNPQTVLKLFTWAKSFKKLNLSKKKKETFIAIFQSILEILAQKAKYAPDGCQYDRLIEKLIRIPLTEESLYDDVFRFFALHLDIDMSPSAVDRSFWNFLLPPDPEVVVHNQTYRLETSEVLKKEILLMLEKQSTSRLSHLVKINDLLKNFRTSSFTTYKRIGIQMFDAFRQLPLPDEIDEATIKRVRENVPYRRRNTPGNMEQLPESYSAERLFKNLDRLLAKKANKAPEQEIVALIQKIKADCLLHELKNFLLTSIYAVTVKNSRLPVFLNPNLTRHHDFSSYTGKTPWNHSAIARRRRKVAGYHLEGGLSRLSITLAFPFSEHIFGREIGYESVQGGPIIYNILDLFPYPGLHRALDYTGLLVKLSEELLEKSRENPILREALKDELMRMCAGYQYRTIMQELAHPRQKGKFNSSLLYVSQLLQLGEVLFKKKKLTAEFSRMQQLEVFEKPALFRAVQEEMDRLGSIYYYTYGTLKPRRFPLFPQPLSRLFLSRRTSVEMINELKVKAAYLSYLKQMPPELLGCMTYRYLLMKTDLFAHGPRVDYHRIYYMQSVFNYLYLNRIFNTLRKQGILRIR